MLIHATGPLSRSDSTEVLQTERFTVTIRDDDRDGTTFSKVLEIGPYTAGYLRVSEHSVTLLDRAGSFEYMWPNSRREWEPGLREYIDTNISDLS